MLAYRNRLIPDNPRIFDFTFMVGEYFATAGFEPKNATIVSIGQWYEFMSGKPYLTPKVDRILSFLERFGGKVRSRRPPYVQRASIQRQWIFIALIGGAFVAKLASLQYSTYAKEEALSRVKNEAPMLEENIRAAWKCCKEYDVMDLQECRRQAEAAGTETGQTTAIIVLYALAKWHMSKSNCIAALTENQCASMLPTLNKLSVNTGS